MSISVPPKGDYERRVDAYFAPIKVSAQYAADMTVQVSEGSYWTFEGEHIEYVGGISPTLTATSAGKAKWSVITLDSNGLVQLLDGTESSSPVLPTIPAGELPLAAIFVKETTTTVTEDMVFDIRPLFVTHAEVVENLSDELADRPTISEVNTLLLAKADVGGTPDSIFVLNQDLTGLGASDAFLTVERGSETNVSIRWNETSDTWELTNDGTTYNSIATVTGTATWGAITGTLTNQTDLSNALNAKAALNHTHVEVDVTDLDKYTTAEVDALVAAKANTSHSHVSVDVTDFSTTVNNIIATTSVNALSDVISSGPADNHVLAYNAGSTNYVNRFLVIDDITSFNAPGPYSSGEVLIHDGGAFANRVLVKADVSDFADSDYVLINGNIAQNVTGDKTFSADVNVGGELNITSADASLLVGPGVGAGNSDAGLQVNRVGSPGGADAIFFWEESTQQWLVGLVGSASAVIDASDLAAGLALKANLVSSATVGNFAGLDGAGDLTDSGSKAADFATAAQGATADTALQDLTTESIGSLSDVDIAGSPTLVSGDGIVYNGTSFRPVAVEPAFAKNTGFNLNLGTSAGTVLEGDTTFAISDMTDVDFTGSPESLLAGDALIYNGTMWQSLSISITESQISDLQSYILATGVTYEQLDSNSDVGTGAGQLAIGDHAHTGVYEPAFAKNTAFNENYGSSAGTVAEGDHTHTASEITNVAAGDIGAITVQAAIDELDTEKAPLASPTFTGTPSAPTAVTLTNTTQLASTAFVQQELTAQTLVNTFEGRSGTVTADAGDYTAAEITNVAAGTVAAITVQAAIDELDTEKTTDTVVATNHYTKTESDATSPAAGAKVSTVAGTSGNVVEFGASNVIVDSGTATADLAPLASPVFTGVPVAPSYVKGSLPAVGSGGGYIYVTDASPAAALCFSNGTNWIDLLTGVTVV